MARNVNIKRIINILLDKDVNETEEKSKKTVKKIQKHESMKPMTKDKELKEINDANLLYIPLLQHIGNTAI